MAGTKQGAAKAVVSILQCDPNHFKRIGRIGGSVSNSKKGFASMPFDQVSAAGTKGGSISKRRPHPKGCTCRSHSVNTWINRRRNAT